MLAPLLAIFVTFSIIVLLLAFFTVRQQSAAVVERFGRFSFIANPGLNLKIPFIDRIAARISLRLQQLDVRVETKTEDNVFVTVMVAVQFFVRPERIYEAHYRLSNPEVQITSFVFDVVRARVPKLKLDDVFEKKDEIADAVRSEISAMMEEFGYGIIKTLVTDVEPDAHVKAAMNEINAAQRLRVAAVERGEAERIMKVKAAEAEAESKALQGRGIADQRRAIVDGLRESIDDFQKAVPGASAQDVMNLVLMTQYFDTIKELGHNSKTNAILLPHSPGGLADLMSQVRNVFMSADLVNKGSAHQ
jgi:regulator of protease activity HflC (stomatin/prohibitin superfamily)